VAQVDPDHCSGCRVCVGDCPYRAIEIVADGARLVARVSEALCKGCGSCAATCPAGAISQLGFTGSQLAEEIAGAVTGR
jgi:heterodisulfide reductase subunit A